MSVSPDEGMQLLAQRYAANKAIAEAAPPGEPAPDGGGAALDIEAALSVFARAASSMENVAARLQNDRRRHFDRVHPVDITPVDRPVGAISQTGAGIYKNPDRWGPQDGWAWRVFGWTISLGAGATSFSIYVDDPTSPSNLVFTSTVSGRWEPAHFYMMPGRDLAVTSVGGPLIFGQGNAAEIDVDYLPTYMGLHP